MAMSLTLSHRGARLRPQAIPSAACVYARQLYVSITIIIATYIQLMAGVVRHAGLRHRRYESRARASCVSSDR